MKRTILFILAFISISNIHSQEDESGFFFGVNIGSFMANKNTAMMYSGGSNYSLYGIEWAFQNPNYKPDLDNYFQYPYSIVELPQGMTYRPSVEIGGIIGYHVDESVALYAEANVGKLKVQDVFVVEIDNPNTNSVQKPLEQFPIYGEEQRLNFNGGARFTVFKQNGVLGYLPLFGNFNSVKLERNYFIVNNKIYNIVHNLQGITNNRPGGVGYGFGTGLGFKYRISDKILVDACYSGVYAKVTMIRESSTQSAFTAWGLHHSILFRILWG
ncbi:MAG: hypothetical protein H6600_08575 [Flavobacteriales bacterium]|nr:hypothetical protein [Flavobacteriales bacterium]MCB9198500.1 hypothetical protein [Flavobacteriales bacterium]